ncbi:MAG: hypothetical protein HUJ94_07900 [Bacteroidales bacterium]|nr:hypothetical protein [Bacteroidales bacterium]
MKSFINSMLRGSAVLLAVAALASCSQTKVKIVVSDAPGAQIVVKAYEVNHLEVVDTLSADAQGGCSYKASIAEGDPMFHYIYYNDRRIASMLLKKGDKVLVNADTLGNYVVSGSEESVRLQEVEQKYNDFSREMKELTGKLTATSDDASALKLRREMTEKYIAYYRQAIRFVMENPRSLTVVPVFYQRVGSDLPVFAQSSDAIVFNNICDSLATVYPKSKYVRSLRSDAQKRLNTLNISSQLGEAEEIGYLDIELPDVNSKLVKLSEVEAKVKVIHFWNPADPAQKMFNQDILIPVYKDYKDRGVEFYCIALDADKAEWAGVVKSQKLEWINVCDVQAAASKYVSMYNVQNLPTSYFICNEELAGADVKDEASLRRHLDNLLKK